MISFRIETRLTISYTSSGSSNAVAMNVRYSAHRFASHSPTASIPSSKPYASSAIPTA